MDLAACGMRESIRRAWHHERKAKAMRIAVLGGAEGRVGADRPGAQAALAAPGVPRGMDLSVHLEAKGGQPCRSARLRLRQVEALFPAPGAAWGDRGAPVLHLRGAP